ncbi:DUF924 family protein [Nitrococcus mobilis]|nr:DUF924 family protein [Nitrococcus mobilis]
MDETACALLEFWFGPMADGDASIAERQAGLWWDKSERVDHEITTRFGALFQQAAAGRFEHWPRHPRTRLALILVLDQLPRHLFRARPEAYAYDPRALELSLQGQALGQDRTLRPVERAFFYLPMEHAESLPIQHQCVRCFELLLIELPAEHQPPFQNLLQYARRHRDIIRRFGRFPHRNAILGRTSTAAEEAFLNEPGSRF